MSTSPTPEPASIHDPQLFVQYRQLRGLEADYALQLAFLKKLQEEAGPAGRRDPDVRDLMFRASIRINHLQMEIETLRSYLQEVTGEAPPPSPF